MASSTQFTWDSERPSLSTYSARRGEDVYSFVLSLKQQQYRYKLWPRQIIKMLKEYIKDDAEKYLVEGIEDAISKKKGLQENFKEQFQSVCSLLYKMFGAPNLSLYIAAEQGAVYIVRNAITTGNIIIMDSKGRPKMQDDTIVVDKIKKRHKKNKRVYDYEWAESVTGDTALHVAAKESSHHHYHICRLLLQAGWNPAKLNVYGETPIDYALSYKKKEYKRVVKLLWGHRSNDQVPLVKFGAYIDHRPPIENVRYTLSLSNEVENLFNLIAEDEIVESSEDELIEHDEEAGYAQKQIAEVEIQEEDNEANNNENEDIPPPTEAENKQNDVKENETENSYILLKEEGKEVVEEDVKQQDMVEVESIKMKKQSFPSTHTPATEEQNLALYHAAYGFDEEVVRLAVEEGHEIFYHYNKYGVWQTRKMLVPIYYNRDWCTSDGMTALHSLCSRKGPILLEGFENKGITIARCLIDNGWDVNKFTTTGDGRSAVYFAERNKLNKIAAILHTTMPPGHKSQKWRAKQTLARNMKTTQRPATRMENHLLLWCARGFVNTSKNSATTIDESNNDVMSLDCDDSINMRIMAKEKEIENKRKAKFYSDVSKGVINRSEREKIEEEERVKLERLKEEEALGIEPYDAEVEGDKICDQLQARQFRKQWLGGCVLAACFHGYMLYEDKGLIKCKVSQPAVAYDKCFVDENGFTALHYAALRGHRKICMILVASCWAVDQTVRRLGQYYNNDCSKLALRGGDPILSEGFSLFTDGEVTDFSTWILEAKAREERRRLEAIALANKLAAEKEERVKNILVILHKCGFPKVCDDAFVTKMKSDKVDDLIHISMEDLIRCGVKKLAARSVIRALPGAVQQFLKNKTKTSS